MRRHLVILMVAATAVVLTRATPIAPPDSSDSALTPADSEATLVDSPPSPSRRQGRFLLLKLLASKLFAAATTKKKVGVAAAAGTAATAGVAGLGGLGGLAGVGAAGPVYVNVDQGVDAGYVDAGIATPGVVGVGGGHAGIDGTQVVGIINVPEPKPEKPGFFSTALKLPGLAFSSVYDTATSTAESIQSAASTAFSLPVKAGQALLDTMTTGLDVGVDTEEYAVGEDYVADQTVYKETTHVQRPHHIIVPIVVKSVGHGVGQVPVVTGYGDDANAIQY